MVNAKVSPGFRCLSIRQPWAWLVCAGAKKFENRSWKTDFRGTIAIHASTSPAAVKDCLSQLETKTIAFHVNDFSYGAIIGLVDIVDVQVYGREHEDDFFASGPYCWRLANPRLLEKPIFMPGKLNLFSLEDAIAAKVRAAKSYSFDFESDSKLATFARLLVGQPSPVDRYNYSISELEDKISDSELSKMASRMIELAPHNPSGYIHRIALQEANATDDIAKADFERLVEIADALDANEDENFEFTLGFCALQLSDENRDQEALRFWRRLIAVDAENAWYRRGYGKSLLSQPASHAEAIAELERAIELGEDEELDDEDVAYLLSTLAEGYRRTHALDRAKATVERALTLDRELVDACYVAARVAIDEQDHESARRLLKKTLLLEPDYLDAAELLQRFQ